MELRFSEQCLCCNRALEQARQQLTSSFASERDTLLKEVQLTKQQQQQALAQAQTGDPHCVNCSASCDTDWALQLLFSHPTLLLMYSPDQHVCIVLSA